MAGVLSTNPYGGTDYFYSVSRGDDSTGDGTPETPYKTFTHLNETLMSTIAPGDRILFRSGDEYWNTTNQAGTADGDLNDLSICWNPGSDPTGWHERNVIGAYEGDTTASVITENVSVKPIFVNIGNNLGFGQTWEQTSADPLVWSGHFLRQGYNGPVYENGKMAQQVASEALVRTTPGSHYVGAGSEGTATVQTIDNFLTDEFDVTFVEDHGMPLYSGVIFTGVTWNNTDINGENLKVQQVYNSKKIQVQRTAHGNTTGSGGTGSQRRIYYRPLKGAVNPNTEAPTTPNKVFAACYGNRVSGTPGINFNGFAYTDAAQGADDNKYLEFQELDIRHSQLGIYKGSTSSQQGLKVHDCSFHSGVWVLQMIASTADDWTTDVEFYNNELKYIHRIGVYFQSNNGNHIGGQHIRIYNNKFYWLDYDGYYHNSDYAAGDALFIGAQNPSYWHVYNNEFEKISTNADARSCIELWQGTTGVFEYTYWHSNIIKDFWGTGIVIGSGVLQGSAYNVISGNLLIGNGGTNELNRGIKSNCSFASKSNIIQNNVVVGCHTSFWDSIGSSNTTSPTLYHNNISINPTNFHFAMGSASHHLYNNYFFDAQTTDLFSTNNRASATTFASFLTAWDVAGSQANNQHLDVANLTDYLNSDYSPTSTLISAGKPAKFNAKDIEDRKFKNPPNVGCYAYVDDVYIDRTVR